MRFPIRLIGGVLLMAAGLCPAAVGQDEAAAGPKAPAAATAADPTIDLEDLRLSVKPLTKAGIEAEVGAWMALLQGKTAELSALQKEARSAEGEARSKLLARITAAGNEQAALIDRARVVLDAFTAKGGDGAEHEKYIDVVSGLDVDVTDWSATLELVKGWLLSPEGGLRWGINVVLFFGTLAAFWILARILGRVTDKAVRALRKTSEILRDFFVNSVRKLTILIGIVVALSMLGVNIGPFVAAIGAVGFVVGFALQGTLSNFASGIMILLYRPYDIGDAVTVAGVSGAVDSMSLVSTTIKTWDNQKVVVPNSSIWGGIITNITGSDTRRVDLKFGISYGDDVAKAHAVLEGILKSHPLVLAKPEPVVKLHELADSSMNFVVRPWVKTTDYWTVYWDVTRAVKERFDAAGISIPFPQRDVHLHQAAPAQDRPLAA